MNRLQLASAVACLAPMISAGAIAAEAGVATQELQNVQTSAQVRSAHWSRTAEEYVLRVSFDRRAVAPSGPAQVSDATPTTATEALERPAPHQQGSPTDGTDPDAGGRQSFFIGRTIANLRGLDPVLLCGRTLALIDGRRMASNQPQLAQPQPPRSGPVQQPYRGAVRDPNVEVWLLKADGTVILPATYRCDPDADGSSQAGKVSEISYGYLLEEGAQAIAAAIRVGRDIFVEKLQPVAMGQ